MKILKKNFEIQDLILPEKSNEDMVTVTYSMLCIRNPKTSFHHSTPQFFQVRQAKIQVSLHILAVWTGTSLPTWKSCYYLASSED